MDIFNRRVSLTGPPAEYMQYATGMRDFVSGKLDHDVSLWSIGLGAPLGTMVYSTRVDGLSGLMAMNAQFAADAEFMQRVAAGDAYRGGPSEDAIGRPVYGEPGDAPPVGSVATVTTAVVAGGQYDTAIGWGVEMAQLVESVGNTPTMFLMNMFGAFGEVVWISVAADAGSADAAGTAVNNDADYQARIKAVGDLFVPASGHRSLAVRVA